MARLPSSHHCRVAAENLQELAFAKTQTPLPERGLEFTPNSCQTSESKSKRIDANGSRVSKNCATPETIEAEDEGCGSQSRSSTAHEVQGLQFRNHDKQNTQMSLSGTSLAADTSASTRSIYTMLFLGKCKQQSHGISQKLNGKKHCCRGCRPTSPAVWLGREFQTQISSNASSGSFPRTRNPALHFPIACTLN